MSKNLIGVVSSTKNDKTITVSVEYKETRPLSARKRHVLAKILNHSELKTQVDKVQTTIESGDLT